MRAAVESVRFSPGWLVLLVTAGLSASAPAQAPMGKPRVVMIVEVSDPAAQPMATRLYLIARENLRKSGTLFLVDTDRRLGARREGRATAKRARTLYEEGRKSYDMLELKQSTDLLQHAARELESRLGELEDRRLYTDIHTYLGSALVLMGNKPEGREVFRKLLTLNDKAELNPMVFPPELTAVFEETAEEVRQSGVGGLDIQVLPPGTEVWVDGNFRGFSPVRLTNLVEGEHILRLVRRGYRSQGWKQGVTRNMSELVQLRLEALPGLGKLQRLTRHIEEKAPSAVYPDGVDTLTRWMQADRLLLFAVGAENQVNVRAYYYDRNFRTCLKSLERTFDPEDPSYLDQLGLFVTTVYMNVEGPARHVTEPKVSTIHLPEQEPDTSESHDAMLLREKSSGIFSSWWFWTAAGVLVAGGVGLALALTLGDPESIPAGEVIFKF